MTIENINWLIVSIYRLPKDSDMKKFFEAMNTSLDMAFII